MPKRLVGALAALSLVAVAAAWLNMRQTPAKALWPLAGVPEGALVKLERGDLVLSKKNGRWSMPKGNADADLSRTLARETADLTLSSKVSDDPDSWEGYGLGEQSAKRLRAWKEGQVAPALDVFLGRPAFGGVLYARLKDDPAVYLADGLEPRLLELPATAYLEAPAPPMR